MDRSDQERHAPIDDDARSTRETRYGGSVAFEGTPMKMGLDEAAKGKEA